MDYLPEKILITCQELKRISVRQLCCLENVEYQSASGYKIDNTPPEEGWHPYAKGTMLQGQDHHFWFRATFKTPQMIPHMDYFLQFVAGQGDQWDSPDPQGLVYLNGKMVQGCDSNHMEVFLEPGITYELHYYFYLGMEQLQIPLNMRLCALDTRSEQMYYDIQTALDSCLLLPENNDDRIAVMSVLEQTVNRIDLRNPGSGDYYRSVDEASGYIAEALYERRCSTAGKPVVSCIGHTHIDVEYLWSRKQTREKIQRSAATVISLMKKYPEYRFMLSQPELYRYLQEEAPEVFAEVKALVAQGRWEPEGAMWVEADCNLISGESFVRQILQGKKFFQETFGVDCKILFLPDVFGYSAAMPQILKKCGIRHFVTSKISWSDTNTMPVDCFMWQGIDGTEIFTNFITAQDYNGPDIQRQTTYIGMLSPKQIKGTWNRFQQKQYTSHAMTTYGYGDGGGGPTRTMLETQRRLAKGLPGMPVTNMTSLLSHLDTVRREFDENCREAKRTPRWVGELYLEFHRGTYTSMAKNKRANRKAEFALQMAEALSYTDLLHGGEYDADGIYNAWNIVLHDQFHDIIPGSSIREVYDGTDIDYQKVGIYCDALIAGKIGVLARGVQSNTGILVYNALGFARRGEIRINGKCAELKEEIPAFGWKVIDSAQMDTDVKIIGLTAENANYFLVLDEAGRIKLLFDKVEGRQILKENCRGNELQIFEDYPRRYDNWEISDYYKQKMWILEDPAHIEPVFDGSRAGFRVTRRYMHSEITQHIWLYSLGKRIDFETVIDWHENHQLLKVAFPLDVCASSAAYEIQFGHVRRPTHENTSWDKAKFEVYGHKWVDVGEYGYGVSLLNDCKYGFNAEGSILKLTMLKCGTYPNETADQGEHRFTYSLLPHAEDFTRAGVIREGYCLNQPLVVMPVVPGQGLLPDAYSLISCDRENVVIETVKKAENSDAMVVRMYESFGMRTAAHVKVAGLFRKVFLCDLLENEEQELMLQADIVEVKLSNFEILTLKFIK